MEKEDFDVQDVGEVISSSRCEEMTSSALNMKEEMYSDESSVVKPVNTIGTELFNSNVNGPFPESEKLPESVNEMVTPFLFVGVKMELPDDYECEASCENLQTQYSSEEMSTIHEREIKGVDECSEGSHKGMIVNNTPYVEVKMECKEDIEICEFDLQTNDDMSMTTDTNCMFDCGSVEQESDVGHSSEKFINGMQCLETPILQVKEEEECSDKEIAVNRKNSAFGRNLNSEEEKELNKTLHEEEILKASECASELNPKMNENELDEGKSLERLTHADNKNPLSCFRCKKFFGGDLEKHIRYSCKVKSHSCEVCSVCFPYMSVLKKHMRTHTGEKPYSCDICQKSFSEKYNLKKHIRIHTGEKPFLCHMCEKSFADRSSLRTHVYTHTGEKPFSCHICKKSFICGSTLKKHLRTHTGEKPFSCHMCDKSFGDSSSLRIHVLNHSGEKPFSCHICQKSFGYGNQFKKHLRTHTGEKPLSCHICHKTFQHTSNLKKHIRTHPGE